MNFRRLCIGCVVLFLVIQFIPANRSNPPAVETLSAPPEAQQILRASCFDCHSYETHWPWYAYVAPASWLVSYDVNEAREHLNFSTWQIYDEEERTENLEEMWEEIEDGNMPLWYYVPFHPGSELDEHKREVLHAWILEVTGD